MAQRRLALDFSSGTVVQELGRDEVAGSIPTLAMRKKRKKDGSGALALARRDPGSSPAGAPKLR